MNCDRYLNLMTDVLTGQVSPEDREACTAHYLQCGQCGSTFERLADTWAQLERLPEQNPGPHVSARFYAMLEGYQHGHQPQTSARKFPFLQLFKLPVWGYGLAAACLFMAGFLVGRPMEPEQPLEIPARMQPENPWFNASSATTRLQGISTLVTQPSQASEYAIPALLYVLETDPSVDVRLAALRALRTMAHHPLVQQGFARAVMSQDAPLVQIGILEFICESNNPQTTDTLENLLQKEPLNPFVKQRAQELLLETR